jgi:hypothetical protein
VEARLADIDQDIDSTVKGSAVWHAADQLLVLQLRFLSVVMGFSRPELVSLSPSRPCHDERWVQGRI